MLPVCGTLVRNSDWTDKTEWAWPDDDEHLAMVFDWVTDIEAAMPFVNNRGFAIQAGGACGVWPRYLSYLFDKVITVEPNQANFDCLRMNVADRRNVSYIQAALGSETGWAQMEQGEPNNAGTWYVKEGSVTPVIILDQVTTRCDLLALDVEGAELDALKGAADLIDTCRPVIMLEEKPLPHMRHGHDEPRKWLAKNFGYEAVATAHRDVIFA